MKTKEVFREMFIHCNNIKKYSNSEIFQKQFLMAL